MYLNEVERRKGPLTYRGPAAPKFSPFVGAYRNAGIGAGADDCGGIRVTRSRDVRHGALIGADVTWGQNSFTVKLAIPGKSAHRLGMYLTQRSWTLKRLRQREQMLKWDHEDWQRERDREDVHAPEPALQA